MAGLRIRRVLARPFAAVVLVAGLTGLTIAPAHAASLTPGSSPSATPGSPASATPSLGVDPVVPAGTVVGGDALAGPGILTDLAPGAKPPPVPKAVGWLVADLGSRQILAAQNVHAKLAPASTMKIFTALTLAPRLDPKTVYTASRAATAVDGTKVGLVAGSTYTVDMLLHGMIMSSGNDCAVALGELAGGQATATGLMQAEARSLGAFDTTVRTTSGLDAPGQASSAYDLALAGAAALQNKQLARIMLTRSFAFPGKGTGLGRKTFSIQTHNKLIYNTPGATGVKNGYTVAARGSFVGSATRNGHSYVAVVVRAEGSTWHQADDLLEWAFRYGSAARPVGRLVTASDVQAMLAPPTEAPDSASGVVAASSGLRGAQTLSGPGLSDRTRMMLLIALAGGLLLALVAGGLMLRPAHRAGERPGRSGRRRR